VNRDELIALLLTMPNLPVYVRAYEYGYLDMKPECVQARNMALDYNEEPSYGGPHELNDDGAATGIVIDRYDWR
jgi:hypothetical protein